MIHKIAVSVVGATDGKATILESEMFERVSFCGALETLPPGKPTPAMKAVMARFAQRADFTECVNPLSATHWEQAQFLSYCRVHYGKLVENGITLFLLGIDLVACVIGCENKLALSIASLPEIKHADQQIHFVVLEHPVDNLIELV